MKSLVLIRHGESQKNKAASRYQQQTKIPFKWQTYSLDPWFLSNVCYSLTLRDCPLSQKGIQDCLRSKQSLSGFTPDLILVSPLERALQSCHIIFPGIKAIVEPLLTETIKHTSQIAQSISFKKERYKMFDFTELQKYGQFWFLQVDVQKQHGLIFQQIVIDKNLTYDQKTRKITQIFQKNRLKESWESVKIRCDKVKEKLKEYTKTYKHICIIGHFFIFQMLTATKFDLQFKPINPINFKNGQALNVEIQTLCAQ